MEIPEPPRDEYIVAQCDRFLSWAYVTIVVALIVIVAGRPACVDLLSPHVVDLVGRLSVATIIVFSIAAELVIWYRKQFVAATGDEPDR